jgi:zinc protease
VSVGGSLQRWPVQAYSVSVQFGSAPERVDSLFTAVRQVIDSAKAGAISDADVARIREQQQRGLEVNLKENGYWLLNLSSRIENGEDPKGLLAYPEFIRGLTKEKLQAAARKYFNDANRARFVLVPESSRTQ